MEKELYCSEDTELTVSPAYTKRGREEKAIRAKIAKARTRWTLASAKLLTLKRQVLTGELIDRDSFEARVTTKNRNYLMRLQGLAQSSAPRVATMATAEEITDYLASQLKAIFNPRGNHA